MTLWDLELFLAVAEERSFGKAAKRLFISQPAISQHIVKIEKELGFPLLHRDRHSVELTAQGGVMQNAARSMLATYRQALTEAAGMATAEETVSIGYVGQMNIHLLPEIMKSFQERYPGYSVQATRVLPFQVAGNLELGRMRMIMTPYDLVEDSPQILFSPLYNDRHYCVMNAEAPLAARESLTYQDLFDCIILTPSEDFCPNHMKQALSELKEVNPACRFEEGKESNNVALQLLSSKKKIAIMPGYTRMPHRNLVSIPLENGIQIRVGVAYTGTLTAMEKEFLSTTAQVLQVY